MRILLDIALGDGPASPNLDLKSSAMSRLSRYYDPNTHAAEFPVLAWSILHGRRKGDLDAALAILSSLNDCRIMESADTIFTFELYQQGAVEAGTRSSLRRILWKLRSRAAAAVPLLRNELRCPEEASKFDVINTLSAIRPRRRGRAVPTWLRPSPTRNFGVSPSQRLERIGPASAAAIPAARRGP